MSKKNLLLLAFSMLWCPSLPAAQDIETIIITASRIPQPLHAVGSSVTVIDLDDWRGTGATISDVLREIPGVSISQSGGSGTLTAVRMRGGESNHTRILLDGIELSDPTSGVVDFAHLSIAGIKRIEVLRGAPSALWGSNAISGIINLISRKGGTSSLTQKSGSNQRHETTLQVATESEDFSMQASAHHFQTQGENISLTGSERDGYRNNTLQWGGQWRPSADTDFRFSARRTHANADYDEGEGGPSDAPYTSRNRRTYLNTSLHTRTGPFKHQANLSYLQTMNQRQDRFPTESKGRRIQADELVWRDFEDCLFGHSCTLGAGLEWSRERYTRKGIEPLNSISSSVFTTLNWQPDPQATVDLSLRRDKNHDFQDADTWRVSFAYQFPGRPTRIYLASGSGIANPTLTERYGYFPDTFQGNPDLQPERSRNTEVGIEHNPNGACCRISLSIFTQRLSDKINGYFDPDGSDGPKLPTATNEAGRSERWGGELELKFDPHPDWTVSAHYAYLHATEPDSGGATDRREIRRPRHQYRLALAHHSDSWHSRLDFTTVRGLLDDDFSSFPAVRKTLGNYYLINLSTRYGLTPKLELLFEARNLLDESYQEVIGCAAPHRNFSAGLVWHLD